MTGAEVASGAAPELWSAWWVWISAALVFGIVEVLLPGFVFLGFAAGAFAIGLLLTLGVAGAGLPWLLVGFGVLSALAYLALRRLFRLKAGRGQVRLWTRDINDD